MQGIGRGDINDKWALSESFFLCNNIKSNTNILNKSSCKGRYKNKSLYFTHINLFIPYVLRGHYIANYTLESYNLISKY